MAEDEEEAGLERSQSGHTLSPRPATVTLGRKESLTKKVNAQDDLRDTMSFYGVQPAATSSVTSSAHNRTLSRGRNRSNSRVSRVSQAQSQSRPLSSQSQTSSSVYSPTRHGAPLPTPKGFYSPQKPAAAVRLEQQEKRDAARRQAQAQVNAEQEAHAGRDTGGEESGLSVLDESRSTDGPQEPNYNHNREHSNRDSLQSLEAPYQSGDNRYPPPQALGTSLTEVPSNPQLSHESSDDLVHRRFSKERPNQGHSTDLPIHRPSAQESRTRRYKTFENPLTTFFFSGRLMTGGNDWYSAILALVLLLAMTGLWIGTTGVWMWTYGTQYGLAKGGGIAVTVVFVYLFGLTLSSFIAAAFRDPGLLPRGLDEDPPMARAQSDSYDLPLDRTFSIGRGSVTVRWCDTCRTYRTPRSSHCRMCGNCVDGIDHHCAYIHTCVGKRNYLAFLTLLISATIASIYIVVFSAVHFMLICRHDNVSFVSALRSSPGAGVSFLLGCLILPGMLFLLAYHIRLMIFNLTTVEQIRESASKNLIKATKRPVNNPFSADSLWRNLILASIGRPQFPSWIDASGWKEVDRRRPNPGLVAQAGLPVGSARSRGLGDW